MNGVSPLTSRPIARRDFSTVETQRHAAWNPGKHATIGTSLKIVCEPVELKSVGRALHADAGLPTAPVAVRPRRTARPASRFETWRGRSETWRRLMVAAQGGQSRAYETLLGELDAWLRRYYARRLPGAAAEDARQDALLAIHAKRQTYVPSRPFGPWVAAIARHKWIDHLRDASRRATVPLDEDTTSGDRRDTALSAVALDHLLHQLKPAQARVIRLVKLQGVSIKDASDATGQSATLVKVNIHRGLKKLAALAACDAVSPHRSRSA
jgi:RNA polymerase sigma factor (sigma-70 family)